MYEPRTYRNILSKTRLMPFSVTVRETDLLIRAQKNLKDAARELVIEYRGYIEAYINTYPEFATTLIPWQMNSPAPMIIRDMVQAGQKAGVGPMAAVSGAIAEYVGKGLLAFSNEVIVENGGDIFIKSEEPLSIGIFAGKSPLSLKIGLKLDPGNAPISVCTSSGTIGHSLSLGKADAVCVVSESCALADAAATAIGNRVKTKADIRAAIEFGKKIEGVKGLLVIIGDKIGAWGEIEIVPLTFFRQEV
jgi:ApbE superfamily uncharacterized protein (UPF0280 family)